MKAQLPYRAAFLSLIIGAIFGAFAAIWRLPVWTAAVPVAAAILFLYTKRDAISRHRRKTAYERGPHAGSKIAAFIAFYLIFLSLSTVLGYALMQRHIMNKIYNAPVSAPDRPALSGREPAIDMNRNSQ